METTEKIVESYCRYIKGWFTIPNIKCKGQFEIDLLAVDAQPNRKRKRFHIECGVSISGSYSKLTITDYSDEELKIREKAAGQRRTMGYFIERKFGRPEVTAELRKYGFSRGNYSKIIVSWGWSDGAKKLADQKRIILWDFRDLLHEIAQTQRDRSTYFTDDTARTIQLFSKSVDWSKR